MMNKDGSGSRVGGLIEEGEAFSRLAAQPRRECFRVIVIAAGQAGLSGNGMPSRCCGRVRFGSVHRVTRKNVHIKRSE